MHACVYMCSHGGRLTRECMHVYICMNMSVGWRSILGVFLFCSQSYIYVYWQGLSAKPGLVVLTSLARQLSRGTLVSVPPCTGITSEHTYFDFTGMLRIQKTVITFTGQVLCGLYHLQSPEMAFFICKFSLWKSFLSLPLGPPL